MGSDRATERMSGLQALVAIHSVLSQMQPKFPLMRLKMQAEGGSEIEPLPLVIPFMLAAMESQNSGPICFVLPRRGPLAHVVALIYALTRFVIDYPTKVRAHSDANFVPGQLVKVQPNNKVFRFGGPCEFDADRIWLEEVNRSTSRVTFNISHVLRLQRTDRVRPAGRIGQDIHTMPAEAPLDQLLGVKTFGNRNLFSNYVLYLEHQNAFKSFLDSVTLRGGAVVGETPKLSALVPYGTIDYSGALDKWDDQSPDGEPLIATTSSLANIAATCHAAPAWQKAVLVNGLDLLSDLQAYDDIAARQRMILLAEHGEEKMMAALAAREPRCRFWRLDDVLANMEEKDDCDLVTSANRLFGPVHIAARNAMRFQIEKHSCTCPELDELASRLEKLNAGIGDSDDDPLKRLTRRLFSLLMSSAELVQPPAEDVRMRLKEQIQTVLGELARNGVWIDRRYADIIQGACHNFDKLTNPGAKLGEVKGTVMLRVLTEAKDARTVIVARTHNQAELIRDWAAIQGLNVPVLTANGIEDGMFFDKLVFPTWLGSAPFSRLHTRHTAPVAVFTGYDFELRWLGQWRSRMRHSPNLPPVDEDARTELLRLAPGIKVHWPDIEQPKENACSQRELDKTGFDIWSFEDRVRPARKGAVVPRAGDEVVPAKYVGFVGASYAYITQNHYLAVVTDLLGAGKLVRTSVPMKSVSDLCCGDFAVFREGGEKDVIQTIADRLLGDEAEKTRRLSRIWADELRKSGLAPASIQAKMREIGAARCLVTIRGWLNDEGRIGPEQKSDLDLIERVTGSAVLKETKDAVWAAITDVRSAHLSAGMRLSSFLLKKLPDCINDIEEGGTRVNVEDLVSAWIVQVEEIAAAFEEVPRSVVNALRWEEESGI